MEKAVLSHFALCFHRNFLAPILQTPGLVITTVRNRGVTTLQLHREESQNKPSRLVHPTLPTSIHLQPFHHALEFLSLCLFPNIAPAKTELEITQNRMTAYFRRLVGEIVWNNIHEPLTALLQGDLVQDHHEVLAMLTSYRKCRYNLTLPPFPHPLTPLAGKRHTSLDHLIPALA